MKCFWKELLRSSGFGEKRLRRNFNYGTEFRGITLTSSPCGKRFLTNGTTCCKTLIANGWTMNCTAKGKSAMWKIIFTSRWRTTRRTWKWKVKKLRNKRAKNSFCQIGCSIRWLGSGLTAKKASRSDLKIMSPHTQWCLKRSWLTKQ